MAKVPRVVWLDYGKNGKVLAYLNQEKPHIGACEVRPVPEGWGASSKRVPAEMIRELEDFEVVPVGHENKPMIHYKGLFFSHDTPVDCIRALYRLYQNDDRVTLDLGNLETGESWHERYDVTGRVHASMGPVRIPILIYNSRSRGGGGILTGCILSIRYTGKNGSFLYKHKRKAA